MNENWWYGLLDFSDDLSTSVFGVMSSLFGGSPQQQAPQSTNDYSSSSGIPPPGNNPDEIDVPARKGGTDFINGAMEFIKKKENAPVTLLGALFVKGAFEAPQKKRLAKAAELSSQANILTATSQDEKWRTQMANASSIGKTNFGLMSTPAYKDLAAVRRARSGGLMQ